VHHKSNSSLKSKNLSDNIHYRKGFWKKNLYRKIEFWYNRLGRSYQGKLDYKNGQEITLYWEVHANPARLFLYLSHKRQKLALLFVSIVSLRKSPETLTSFPGFFAVQ
jgi:hypothetical protein